MAEGQAYVADMDCSEVHAALATGEVGAEATAHAATCAACAELLADDAALGRALHGSLAPAPASATREALAARLAREPRRSPARWSTPVRGVSLVALLVAVVAGTALLGPRADLGQLAPGHLVLVLGGLVGATFVGFEQLLRPLHRPELPGWRRRLSVAVMAGLPLALLALPSADPMPFRGVLPAAVCFAAGSAFAALGLWGLRAFDRRPTVGPARRVVHVGVGALLGILYLQLHCADRDPVHMVLGHGAIAAVWMATVAVIWGSRETSAAGAST